MKRDLCWALEEYVQFWLLFIQWRRLRRSLEWIPSPRGDRSHLFLFEVSARNRDLPLFSWFGCLM